VGIFLKPTGTFIVNLLKPSKKFVLVFLFISSAAFAGTNQNQFPTIQDFGDRWIKSDWIKSDGVDTGVRSRIFMRVVRPPHHEAYSVGNVTYFKIPKGKNGKIPFSYDQVLKALTEGMEIKWEQRTLGATHIYEGVWTPLHRFMRMYVRENSDSVEYSVAIMRATYFMPTGFESEIIQRELFNILPDAKKPSNKWLNQINASLEHFRSLLIPEAEAQQAGGCDCTNVTQACGPTCYGAGLINSSGVYIGPGSSGSSGSSSGTTTTTPTTPSAPVSTGGTTTTTPVTTSPTTGTGTGTTPTTGTGTTPTTGTGSSGTINAGGIAISIPTNLSNDVDSVTSSLQQAVSIMKKETQLPTLFLQAGATAFGATLGSSLAGLAVEGIKMGITAFASKMGWVKKQTDDQVLSKFRDMRDSYLKTKNSTLALESSIDAVLKSMEALKKEPSKDPAFKGLGSSTFIVEDLGPTIKKYQGLLDAKKKEKDFWAAQADGANCLAKTSQEEDDLEKQIHSYQFIQQQLGPSGGDMCRMLSDQVDTVLEAESELQHQRLALFQIRSDVDVAVADRDKTDEKTSKKLNKDPFLSKGNVRKEMDEAYKENKRNSGPVTADQQKVVNSCKSQIEQIVKSRREKMKGVFKGNPEEVCESFVRDGTYSSLDLISNFYNPADQKLAYAVLKDSGVIADAAELGHVQILNQESFSRTVADIDSNAKISKKLNALPLRNGAVSQGELRSFNNFFLKLKFDLTGSALDDKFSKLLNNEAKIQEVCGSEEYGQGALESRNAKFENNKLGTAKDADQEDLLEDLKPKDKTQ
jgi:hypothetical protein